MIKEAQICGNCKSYNLFLETCLFLTMGTQDAGSNCIIGKWESHKSLAEYTGISSRPPYKWSIQFVKKMTPDYYKRALQAQKDFIKSS